jgi:hypothetical protein
MARAIGRKVGCFAIASSSHIVRENETGANVCRARDLQAAAKLV